MKKIITMSLLLIFILAGCVGQNDSKQDESEKIFGKLENADFKRPEKRANISGIVKNIIGNEVTILKIERPEMSNENENPEKDESEKKTTSSRGMGMGGNMGRLNTSTGDKENDERLEKLKSMSVGEEKVTIPVGIKMLKSNNGKAVMSTLNDIKKDQILMIWVDKDITDKNIATFVMIK